jgi:hypothetical protein
MLCNLAAKFIFIMDRVNYTGLFRITNWLLCLIADKDSIINFYRV